MNNSNVGQHHQHNYIGGAASNGSHNNSSYGKGFIKKKVPHGKPHQQPFGHIASGNSTTLSLGLVSTDFKSTMKHNSSNHSIPSKKMISTIRKPSDLLGGGMTHYGHGGMTNAHGAAKKNYLSPYS